MIAEGSRTFNRGLLPYPTQTEISLESLNRVTILCMEDYERHKYFAIMKGINTLQSCIERCDFFLIV